MNFTGSYSTSYSVPAPPKAKAKAAPKKRSTVRKRAPAKKKAPAKHGPQSIGTTNNPQLFAAALAKGFSKKDAGRMAYNHPELKDDPKAIRQYLATKSVNS